MNDAPQHLRYAPTHEWLQITDDGLALVGITDFAQASLGDIVYVELPEPGATLIAGDEACIVESVKAASEIYAPISGTVESVNETLADAPEIINKDCYEAGWLLCIQPTSLAEVEALLSAGQYQESCEDGDGDGDQDQSD